MIGLGTIINVVAIIVGGILGVVFGNIIQPRYQDTLMKGSAVCVLFIGIAGTLEKMLSITDKGLSSGGTMMMIASIAIGAIVGEWIDLDTKMEQFGEWLKKKTGSEGEATFVDGFVTASLTVSIGAMAIVGAIQDGIYGDHSVLIAKAILDLIIVMIMASSMGKGCAFSAIPVGILQGSVTVLARLIEPVLTEAALANLSLVGAMLIFCVGVNLLWGKMIRVANLLPALVVAVVWAFLPL